MALTPRHEVRLSALQLAVKWAEQFPQPQGDDAVVTAAEKFERFLDRAVEPKDFDS